MYSLLFTSDIWAQLDDIYMGGTAHLYMVFDFVCVFFRAFGCSVWLMIDQLFKRSFRHLCSNDDDQIDKNRNGNYLSLNSVPPFEDSSSSSDSPDDRNCEFSWSRGGMPRHRPHKPLFVSADKMYIFPQRIHSSCGSPVKKRKLNS